jgi:dihydrofolate reductase
MPIKKEKPNPKVTLLMAITVDGRTGRDTHHFVDWTGREDKQFFVETTMKAGVVMMGARTYDTIGYPLPGRKNIILTRNPDRKSSFENLVFTRKSPELILADLATDGYTHVILAGGPTTNTLFARKKLIDEIIVTISPKIFGVGTSLFTQDISMDLELKHLEKRGQETICISYKVLCS